MGKELGRISGPLLSSNLLRNGDDLAFETSLLYLNVNAKHIGVNNGAPVRDLTINGLTKTTDLLVDDLSTLGNLEFSGHQIQNAVSSIIISPNQTNPIVSVPKLTTDNLVFDQTTISSLNSNDIEFNSSNSLVVDNNVLINGAVHATGNITFDGDITFGDSITDTVTFTADVSSNVLPNVTLTHNLGSSSNNWSTVYVENVFATTQNQFITTGPVNLQAGNILLSNNTISDSVSDISFSPASTATKLTTGLMSFVITPNNLVGDPANPTVTLQASGLGHFKFSGTGAVAFPAGTDATRPQNPELGMTRWNTQRHIQEIWNGAQWQNVLGAGGLVTRDQVTDIMDVWSIILG